MRKASLAVQDGNFWADPDSDDDEDDDGMEVEDPEDDEDDEDKDDDEEDDEEKEEDPYVQFLECVSSDESCVSCFVFQQEWCTEQAGFLHPPAQLGVGEHDSNCSDPRTRC